MSTLDEIETAASLLPREQQLVLVAHLSARLEKAEESESAPVTSPLMRSKRGFPISKGGAPFGCEEVARIEAEADFPQQ